MTRIILVPGLRGAVPEHWQEHLAARSDNVLLLPRGREPLDLASRVDDLDHAVHASTQPPVLVAHSAGCLVLARWAADHPRRDDVTAALLVTPPALIDELPPNYPRLTELRAAGYLPWPSRPLPFRTTVCVSDDDPLGPLAQVLELADRLGAGVVRLGAVGHANPMSGYGCWPDMERRVLDLAASR